MHRYLRITLKIAAVFVLILTSAGLFLIWRLSTGPITSDILTPYLERGINRLVPGSRAEIAHTLVTWDNVSRTVSFHADGLKVKDAEGLIIAEVPVIDMQLSAFGIMFGQFLPTAMKIDDAKVTLERAADGHLYFGGVRPKKSKSKNTDIGTAIAKAANSLAHAYFTDTLEINRASLDIHDAVHNTNWVVHVPQVLLQKAGHNLAGELKIDLTQEKKRSTLNINYSYDRKYALHTLTTQFEGITPAQLAGGHPETLSLGELAIFNLPLTGEISLSFGSDLDVEAGALQLKGGPGTFNYPNFWDKPRKVKSMEVAAIYDKETHELNVSKAHVDFGGPTLTLSLGGKPAILSGHDFDFVLKARMEKWPMDEFPNLWPKPVVADARNWMVESLTGGTYDFGEGTFKGYLSWDDLENLVISEGSGKIGASNGTVDYLSGMPKVHGVNAKADFDLKQMRLEVSGGGIGNVKIAPFTSILTGFDEAIQFIDIPLNFTAPISDVLKLLDEPRLNYAKAIGISPDDVNGKAAGIVRMKFPLYKDLDVKDMEVSADVRLSDVSSSKLVKKIDITQGDLNLGLSKESFTVQGPALLNKVPFQVMWEQFFAEKEGRPLQHGSVKGKISGDQWKILGIDALSGPKGTTEVSLDLTQPSKGVNLIAGVMDMTNAELTIEPINWTKAVGEKAAVNFTAEFTDGKDTVIKSVELNGVDATIKGDAVLSPEGTLVSLNLNPLKAGRTDAVLHYNQVPDGDHAIKITAEGNTLDISGLKTGEGEPDKRPKEIRVDLKKLHTSETGIIEGLKGHAIRDGLGWKDISLHGAVNGGHKLDIDLLTKPAGHKVFAITCDDFGKALQGMGFTDNIRDGRMIIRGSSTADNPRMIEGTIRIGHFVARDLPVLMTLMNMTSPLGFGGLLTSTVEFDKMRGKFRWIGDVVELQGVRATGPAVGMNIDGRINIETNVANIHGTMAPFNMANNIIGSIPIIGDIFTGGEGGGILAVAYGIDGKLDDPSVSVNPISLITPGFIRDIFFGGDEGEDVPDEDEDKSEKPQKPDLKPFPAGSK